MPDLDRLLDDFATRFARGERPDAGDYVSRAGPDGAELRELIDALLVAAPPPAADEESVALMQAWADGEPPLLELRRRRGRRREVVVEAILAALRLDPATGPRVAVHYHRLESGLLDARRVDRRVMAAIAGAIGTTAEELAVWAVRPPPALPAAALLRTAAEALPAAPAQDADTPPPKDEPDDVARLFGVGG